MTDPNTKTPLPQRLRPDCEAEPVVKFNAETMAAKVGVYYANGVVDFGAPLYAFTPGELRKFVALIAPVPTADRLAYEGAREDLLDWKARALKAEAKLAEALEPVAIVQHSNRIEWLEDFPAHCAKPGTKLYAATPAPAVPDAEAMAQAASDFFADMTNDDNTLAFDHCSSYDIDMLVAAMLSAAPKPEAL